MLKFIRRSKLHAVLSALAEEKTLQKKLKQLQFQNANVKKKPKKAGLSPVAQALAEAGYFTETEARPKAKFYIFICSASWCGPCRALMPQVVEEYEKNMKKDKTVSMVLLGHDDTEEEAKKYIDHYETDMPGVLSKAAQLPNRPDIPGIPWYFILNAKGELVSVGAGSKVLNWKEEIKKKPQKAEKPKKQKKQRGGRN